MKRPKKCKQAIRGRHEGLVGKLVNIWSGFKDDYSFYSGLVTTESDHSVVVSDSYQGDLCSVKKPFYYEILGDLSGRLLGVF